ncbi:MAG: hypothetical protein ACRD29_05825 [Acidimicrobiales bacterium]
MARAGVLLVEFNRGDVAQVLEHMGALAASHDGWINLQPNVDPDDVPGTGPNLLAIFSARGPAIPLATWTPGEQSRRRTEPPSIGIQHPAGSRAVPVLRDRGMVVPDGWFILQDHPKRGLVLRMAADVAHAEVLEWLLEAAASLCAYELPDSWLAAIHTRS